jgi:hypothetical protein
MLVPFMIPQCLLVPHSFTTREAHAAIPFFPLHAQLRRLGYELIQRRSTFIIVNLVKFHPKLPALHGHSSLSVYFPTSVRKSVFFCEYRIFLLHVLVIIHFYFIIILAV